MHVEAGQRVVVSSALTNQQFEGTLVELVEDKAVLAIAASGVPFTPGNVLKVDIDGYSAAGILQSVENPAPYSMLKLNGFCWISKKPRATRHPAVLRVAVDFLFKKEVRKTVGETTDLSRSGVRVRLRNSIAVGTVARLVIRVGTTDEVEALGRVRRIVNGSEGLRGGYDVAFSFERILKGETLLVSLVGDIELQPSHDFPTGAFPDSDPDLDWFAPSAA